MVCTTNVFANRHARAGGDARPYNTIGTGAECMCTNERIRIVTYDMMRGRVSLYIRFPSSGPRGVGDAAPYGVVFDLSRPLTPPWLHKTPGGKKTKKPKRGVAP